MKLLLPSSIPLAPTLPAEVTTVVYDVAAPVPDQHLDAEALVVWGNREADLAAVAGRMPGLRWVQTLAAGPDVVLAAGFPSDVVITSGVGLHDLPVTEHTVALMLSLVRRLPAAAAAQAEHRWDTDLGGLQPLHPPGAVTTLIGARVLIWGFGSIAQRLAGVLTALSASVRGVARSAGRRGGYDVVAAGDVDQALSETDVLVMLLPATPETSRVLDARRLAQLPASAYVLNVGRGSSVDEPALVDALQSGRLAGAALDVTSTEPLPSSSPLWQAPRLLITPHAAGGRPVGGDDLIAANVTALLRGTPLRNQVDRVTSRRTTMTARS